jgi:hypothetical protein
VAAATVRVVRVQVVVTEGWAVHVPPQHCALGYPHVERFAERGSEVAILETCKRLSHFGMAMHVRITGSEHVGGSCCNISRTKALEHSRSSCMQWLT